MLCRCLNAKVLKRGNGLGLSLPDASCARLPGSFNPNPLQFSFRERGDEPWTLKNKKQTLAPSLRLEHVVPFLTGKSYINNNDLLLRFYPPPRSVYMQPLYAVCIASDEPLSIGSRDAAKLAPLLTGTGALLFWNFPFPYPPTSQPAGVNPNVKLKHLSAWSCRYRQPDSVSSLILLLP
jgi:hypothetical protein